MQGCLQSRPESHCSFSLPARRKPPASQMLGLPGGFRTHTSVGSDPRSLVHVWPPSLGSGHFLYVPPPSCKLGGRQESRQPGQGTDFQGWETLTQSTRASVSGRLGRKGTSERAFCLPEKKGRRSSVCGRHFPTYVAPPVCIQGYGKSQGQKARFQV